MKCFIPPYRAASRRNAFSLVEIVIALAVTTFCIIILFSLLPVGVNTALESRRETRSSYLAEQIVSDLRSSSFTNATILCQTNGTLAPLTPFSLAVATTNCVSCDGGDNVLYQIASSQYAAGVSDPSANYLVQVAVTPTAITNLSSVSVEVSAPAQGALTSRTRYDFQTMIGNRQ